MPRGLDPVLVGAFAAQAAAAQRWLDALTDTDLDVPTRLSGWRVAELAVHLTQAVRVYAEAPAVPGRGPRPITVAAYLAGYGEGAAEIAAREVEAARGLAAATAAADFAEVVARAQERTADLADTDPVVAGARGPVRASDLLRTRVLELVVHALDVGPGWPSDRQAVRVCVRLLAEVLGERHGGKAIEVRVPPYAAVQIGAGVTHTRGTPPNVVECSPEVFVAVASGRRTWADAVAAGQVRASGSRADLREYLPLL